MLSDFIAFKLYIDLTYAICANILAILISTMRGQELDKLDCTFPKGIWPRFDFDDSHPVSITAHFALLFGSQCLPIINTLYSLFSLFFWTCQDLPALYLQGGSIIPLGPPHQHVGEANPSDDLTLLVALDEHGKFIDFSILQNRLEFFSC